MHRFALIFWRCAKRNLSYVLVSNDTRMTYSLPLSEIRRTGTIKYKHFAEASAPDTSTINSKRLPQRFSNR